MISEPLTDDEKRILLKLARHSIELAASNHPLPELVLSEYSAQLQQEGASFVTLTEYGELKEGVSAPWSPTKHWCKMYASMRLQQPWMTIGLLRSCQTRWLNLS